MASDPEFPSDPNLTSDLGGGWTARAAVPHERAYRRRERLVALGYGIVCHTLFAVAIAGMIFSIGHGLQWGFGPFQGSAAGVANLLLVVQFPVLHSWLLSDRGRDWLNRLAPLGLGRDLAPTNYAAIASLQLLATFALWSPSHTIWWQAAGSTLLASSALYAGAWLLLLKAMSDSGLDLQSGFCGWGAVIRNRRPRYRTFSTRGLYRHTRQPVYVAFCLILWTAPVWTPDRLLLCGVWTLYCALGPRLKEARYLRFDGERYRHYQSLVPYWLPNLRPCAAPALASSAPAPDTNRA